LDENQQMEFPSKKMKMKHYNSSGQMEMHLLPDAFVARGIINKG
jgi:hypothetical protein